MRVTATPYTTHSRCSIRRLAWILSPAKAERVRNRSSHNIALRTTMRVPPPGMASVVVSLPESAQPAVTPRTNPARCLATKSRLTLVSGIRPVLNSSASSVNLMNELRAPLCSPSKRIVVVIPDKCENLSIEAESEKAPGKKRTCSLRAIEVIPSTSVGHSPPQPRHLALSSTSKVFVSAVKIAPDEYQPPLVVQVGALPCPRRNVGQRRDGLRFGLGRDVQASPVLHRGKVVIPRSHFRTGADLAVRVRGFVYNAVAKQVRAADNPGAVDDPVGIRPGIR